LVDFTGKAVKLDSKSQLVPEKAPPNKDASNYYINFNYAAGKGAKPGWVLDGKVAPVVGKLYYGYQISPSASADVGQNQGLTTESLQSSRCDNLIFEMALQ